jgi:predicted Zn-dependent protease
MAGASTAPAQNRLSAEEQIKLGQQEATKIRKAEKVLPDSDARTQVVRRVGKRILAQLPTATRDRWDFTFDVIDSKEVNAFALPGGPLFFYTGLLERMKTEDEVAAVVAHEMAHVTREHWAVAYRNRQERNLWLSLGMVVFDLNREARQVVGIGSAIFADLPYGRNQEMDADSQGFDLMVKAGYNPRGMRQMFETLSEAGGGKQPPERLSTHPSDKRRIDAVDKRLAKPETPNPPMRPLPWAKTPVAG